MPSMEVEYIAASYATKQAVRLGRLASIFRLMGSTWTLAIYNDSQGVVDVGNNLIHPSIMKYKEEAKPREGLTANDVSDAMKKTLTMDHFYTLQTSVAMELIPK